jgi:hypothetical protein
MIKLKKEHFVIQPYSFFPVVISASLISGAALELVETSKAVAYPSMGSV